MIVTSELEDKVLVLYAKGMSTRDISGLILEMYAMEISATEISHITDCVIPALNERKLGLNGFLIVERFGQR